MALKDLTLKELFNIPTKYELNDFQSHFVQTWKDNKEANFVVAYPTSSGKSSTIYFLGNLVLNAGKKVVYTAPTKALLEEKQRDFVKYNLLGKWEKLAVVTGDYGKEDKTDEVLTDKNVVCISQESLVSHLRKHVKSGDLGWLSNIGLLVIDEGHLVADSSRGANLEVALFELLTLLPTVQILFISGTLLNSQDFVKWIGNISERPAVLVEGTYRPHQNNHVFMKVRTAKGKEGIEIKNRVVSTLVDKHTDLKQKGVVPVFKKLYGVQLTDLLRKNNVRSEFHYGDLSLNKRTNIETLYRNGHIDALVCTQTLFVGLDLDAEYGIMTSVTAGGGNVPAYQIQQAAGRVGRHAPGTVYYLLPDNDDFDYHVERITKGEPIMSVLIDYRQLLTHVLGAIYAGWIKNDTDLVTWYRKSLAFVQNAMPTSKLLEAVESLRKMGYVAVISDSYTVSHKGKICSQYMMCPLDVYDWVRNLRKYYALSRKTTTDLACAYGEISRFYSNFISIQENHLVPTELRKKANGSFWKGVTPIYCKIKGLSVPDVFYSQYLSFYTDINRMRECLSRINNEIERWTDSDTFERDINILVKGENAKDVGLSAKRVTKRDRQVLSSLGITTMADVANNTKILEQYGVELK
jgi:replicative superfamily II helicase